MVLFPRLFGQSSGASPRGRKANVNDRLDHFVSTVARRVEEREEAAYVIDKNYEVVYTGPTPTK